MELKKESALMTSRPAQPIGKSQLYALLVDEAGAPVLDGDGAQQVVAVQSTNGRIQVDSSIVGSLANVVVDYFEGSATVTRTYALEHTRLEIANDGASSLTFTVDSLPGRTFTLLAGDVREFDYPAFKVIVITTTVAYRATVMGGTAEVGVNS